MAGPDWVALGITMFGSSVKELRFLLVEDQTFELCLVSLGPKPDRGGKKPLVSSFNKEISQNLCFGRL